jgi:2-octaprenyl-6-methoxyphenol hydroxylase
MINLPEHCDILVIGAGPVGMTLAAALADSGHDVRLVDRNDSAKHQFDPRALALSEGARQLLARLDAWPTAHATAIETIHISQRGGFGRTLMDCAEHGLPALGHVLRYRDLAATLTARLNPAQCCNGIDVEAIRPGTGQVRVTLRQGETRQEISARLVVHAEGTPWDEEPAHDYVQHAVIAEVRPVGGHAHRAWERFTPDGPLALLPLGDDFSVVFTVPPAKSDWLMGLDEDAFLAALTVQFGRPIAFSACGPRSRFPLALRLREEVAAPREVWIGNSAQTLHPVSGQGFNLGLRDAWQLAELLPDAADPGAAEVLAAYTRSRRLDRIGGAQFTDKVVRLFSNDVAPLRWARGLGLLALDLCPAARRFVAGRMIWGARAWP